MEITANGTTLYAERTGTGRALVFVHGMCGDARVWSDQVERLSGRFQCVAYDRRGHTRSPRTDVGESVQLHADDLAGLISALGLAPCVAVGSSGGARIVVDTIRRYPALFSGAVVSEPPIGALAPEAFAEMISVVAPRVKNAADTQGPRAAVDTFFDFMCPGLWSVIDESTKDHYRDNSPMLFADLGMPPYSLTQGDAAAIEVPAVVIGGRTSQPALFEGARTLAGWLPHSEWVEMDCGHVTYAEQPEVFAAVVSTFASAR